MSQTVHYLDSESLAFPPTQLALTDPNGLIAIGGDLSPQRLVSAYEQAIFPWFNAGEPIMWWSPSPRAIIPVNQIKINRTLTKFIKKNPYQVTLNKDFDQVISNCAHAPFRKEGTWIVDDMKLAYMRLHELGYAHSIEVWQHNELVGGLYGVAINGFFSGESMFYKKNNASKVALISLAELLKTIGVSFIDCQILNPFLDDMGCIEIDRDSFTQLQQVAITKIVPKDFWHSKVLTL
jgi:leucyl/phenylalanyl-tRNA--protein transferase|tara:strand:- start:5956 stop:6663 length:708 start_codon:yes stop_codon:yes gene_type:complete